MPLIIHPSSCCDVCLEPLTYDEPRPPFAIPCGHIFCREYVLFPGNLKDTLTRGLLQMPLHDASERVPAMPETVHPGQIEKADHGRGGGGRQDGD